MLLAHIGETGDGDTRRSVELFASPVVLMKWFGVGVCEVQGSDLPLRLVYWLPPALEGYG